MKGIDDEIYKALKAAYPDARVTVVFFDCATKVGARIDRPDKPPATFKTDRAKATPEQFVKHFAWKFSEKKP